MKKIIAIALTAILVVMAFCSCGTNKAEQTDYEYIKEKGKLIVGITDFAPMDYKEAGSDEWVGFDAEYAKAFCKWLDIDVEFIEIEWDYKEFELDGKTIDCVWNGMTLTDGVKAAMETSLAYCENAQVVVMKTTEIGNYTTVDSIKDIDIACENGSAGDECLTDLGATKINKLTTQADALMEVAAGTSKACVIDLLMAQAMTGEGTSYPDLTYSLKLNAEEYGVGFRKGSDMAAKLNEFFKICCADGTAKALSVKYDVAIFDIK